MQIVIDIPEETYKDIIKNGFIYDEDNEVITYAIKNSTFLSKGHGRLIDADAFIDTLGISDRDIYAKECIEEYILTQS